MYSSSLESAIPMFAKILLLFHGLHVTFSDRTVTQSLANNLNETNFTSKLESQNLKQGPDVFNNVLRTNGEIEKSGQEDYEDHRTLEKLKTIEREMKARNEELKAQERIIGEAEKEIDLKRRKLIEKQLELDAWKKELKTWELRWELHIRTVTDKSQSQKEKLIAKKQATKKRQQKIQARLQRLENLIQKSKDRQNELAADMQKLNDELLRTHKKFQSIIHQALVNVCDSGKNMLLLQNTLKSGCQSCQSYRDSHIQSLNDKTIEDVMRGDKVYHTEYVYDYERGVSVRKGYTLDLNDPNPRCAYFGPETVQIKIPQNSSIVSDTFV